MPTVIDSLLVTLGLDASAFKKGQREVTDSFKKTKTDAQKHGVDIEGVNKKLLESFNKLKVEAVAFLAALAGAREIKEFVTNVTQADAAVGRLAANLGENPQMMQAWGLAIERMGGNASEAATSLGAVAKAFYDLKYNGKALPEEVYRVFAMAHRPAPTTADSLDTFLNKTAGALKEIAAHDRTAAFFFGQGMGLSDTMITLMLQYGDAVSRVVAANKGLAATDAQIANAQKLQERWNKLSQTVVSIGRDIMNWFSPAFLAILDKVQEAFSHIHSILSEKSVDAGGGHMMDWFYKHLPGGVVGDGVPTTAPTGGGGGAWAGKGAPPVVRARSRSRRGTGGEPASTEGGTSGDVGKWWTPDRMQYASDRLKKEAGLSEAGAAALVARWAGVEARGGPDSVNPISGAAGIAQGLGSRKAGYQGSYEDQVTNAINELNGSEKAAGNRLRSARTLGEGAAGASAFERAEGYDPRTGRDNFTDRTPTQSVLSALRALKSPGTGAEGGKPAGDGPVIFGDSIAAGLKDYGHTQGAAVESMGSQWILNQIKNFGGDLKGKKVVLSTGASNSHDPYSLEGQLYALKKKGVDPKDITVLGVGDRGDFAGYNDTLKNISEGVGAKFQPITPGPDHVHPNSYKKLWDGIPGLSNGITGPHSSLSTLHMVHPVTTSQVSNRMSIGQIHVNAPQATDAHGIADHIYGALSGYQMSMSGQSGQV